MIQHLLEVDEGILWRSLAVGVTRPILNLLTCGASEVTVKLRRRQILLIANLPQDTHIWPLAWDRELPELPALAEIPKVRFKTEIVEGTKVNQLGHTIKALALKMWFAKQKDFTIHYGVLDGVPTLACSSPWPKQQTRQSPDARVPLNLRENLCELCPLRDSCAAKRTYASTLVSCPPWRHATLLSGPEVDKKVAEELERLDEQIRQMDEWRNS